MRLPPLEGNVFATVGVEPRSVLGRMSAGTNPRRSRGGAGVEVGWLFRGCYG